MGFFYIFYQDKKLNGKTFHVNHLKKFISIWNKKELICMKINVNLYISASIFPFLLKAVWL